MFCVSSSNSTSEERCDNIDNIDVHRKPKQYRSKSPQEFEKSCIERFEKLDTTHVSTALNDFFKRYVMFT